MTSLSIDKGINIFDVVHKTEAAFLSLITFLFGVNLMMSFTLDRAVAWETYAPGAAACVGLILCGLYIRFFKGAERRAKITIVIGLNSLFGLMTAVFFHLNMPRPEPILSDFLLGIDNFFGYHWPTAVAWVAETPNLGYFLRVVYLSSFAQIVVVMMLLAYLNRMRQLDAMIFTNAFSLVMVYAVWQAFPNMSQSTYLPLPIETEIATDLVTNSILAGLLSDYAQNGLELVTMEMTLGVVAFPSYHMVMSVLVVWFARRTVLFIPILILNIIMFPAILIHGAHHIADLVGGTLVMFAALVPAYAVVNHLHSSPSFRHRPA